jgi:hypothetical protein
MHYLWPFAAAIAYLTAARAHRKMSAGGGAQGSRGLPRLRFRGELALDVVDEFLVQFEEAS